MLGEKKAPHICSHHLVNRIWSRRYDTQQFHWWIAIGGTIHSSFTGGLLLAVRYTAVSLVDCYWLCDTQRSHWWFGTGFIGGLGVGFMIHSRLICGLGIGFIIHSGLIWVTC